MKIYSFTKASGKNISEHNSDFILSRISQTKYPAQIVCMHLEENGVIGYHQAVIPQLLLIVSGEGFVRGKSDERLKVRSGDAVFWDKGEWHETVSPLGLTAIVIESEELDILLMDL